MASGDFLPFVKLSAHARAPFRASVDAAGVDLFAAEDVDVPPGGRACVKTDIQVAVPRGFYGRIAPRSGLAVRHGIDVGGGVIDADYRGNVAVILFNFGDSVFRVKRGDRVAQLLVEKISVLEPLEVASLENTVRGQGGFGSSGLL